jgi:hypothetical protein
MKQIFPYLIVGLLLSTPLFADGSLIANDKPDDTSTKPNDEQDCD